MKQVFKVTILGDKFKDLGESFYFDTKQSAEELTERIGKILGHEIDWECETIPILSSEDNMPDILELSVMLSKSIVLQKSKGEA